MKNTLESKALKEKKILLSLFDKGDFVLFKWNNDEKWSVDYVSLGVFNLLGYKKNEFLNNTISYSDCIHKDDLERVVAEVQLFSKSNNDFFKHEPYRIITKSGDIKWVKDYTVMIKNADNEITYYLGYINDITQERERDKLLYEQLKLAAMGEMIGNIAHQWRQPLSMISTSSTGLIVQKEFGLLSDEEFYKMCNTINENAQYLSKTIDDFRNFIKGNRTKKFFSLKDEIDSFLNLVEGTIKNNQINIILDLQDNIQINGYANELTQCFINIFNNAKDILNEKNITNKLLFISTTIINNKVNISIKDNGGGIPTDILPKIFDSYFTTKDENQGTGLGLHMTYKLIVDGMEGTVEAHNIDFEHDGEAYIGAEFNIIL